MKKDTISIIVVVIGLIILAIWFANNHYNNQLDPEGIYSADLAVEKPVCPPCDCTITAERIISNNPAIELPDRLVSFKYDGKIYTKAILDEAKLTLDAIK